MQKLKTTLGTLQEGEEKVSQGSTTGVQIAHSTNIASASVISSKASPGRSKEGISLGSLEKELEVTCIKGVVFKFKIGTFFLASRRW